MMKAIWNDVRKWAVAAAAAGERRRVFWGSMMDVCEDRPDLVEPRKRFCGLVEELEDLDFLILTKRPENYLRLMPWGEGAWPRNAWAGTSTENEATLFKRGGELVKVQSRVRWLSMEPMLESIDMLIDGEFSDWACHQCGSHNVDTEVTAGPDDVGTYECRNCEYFGSGEDADWKSLIHWVIVGGESGPGARAFDINWARGIRKQCKAASVACFIKQLGAKPFDASLADDVPGAHHKTSLQAMKIPEVAERVAETIQRCVDAMVIRLKDKKGGDMAEWPEDLRVREVPA